MILPSYSLFGAVSIIIFSLFFVNTLRIKQNEDKSITSFRILILWVTAFSVLDFFWGLCESNVISNPRIFFIISTLFHLSTVITAIIWSSYIVNALGENLIPKEAFIWIYLILFGIHFSLLIANCFKPIIFYITEDNKYVTASLRPIAFYNQYILYLGEAIVSVFRIFRSDKEHRSKHIAVFSFISSPLIFGILQLNYPNVPYYSIGYLIGCIIIYSFVVSNQEILFLKNRINEQKNQYDDYYDHSQKEINRNLEILYSMADIYYSMHLIDLVKDSVTPYSARDEVKEIVNKQTDACSQMKEVISSTVIDTYREAALRFTDLKTLPKRMKNRKILEAEFVGTRIGWFAASFIKMESDSAGRPAKVIFTTRSIDEEKRKEENLIYKSNTDEMTGFYNRRAYDMAEKELEKSGIDENFVYVSIDINGLKVVNDSIGHAAGDELILGACTCMKEAFGNYGKLFRIGGDEFVAIIYADDQELAKIKKTLETEVSDWKGQFVDNLTLSCGYVVKSETAQMTLHDISVLADKRMYEEKSLHYRRTGFDRRGQRDAHVALCALYTKILKINLSDDSYQIINMDLNEQKETMGFASKISEWFKNFGMSGLVHPEDLEEYLAKTDLSYIREYFRTSSSSSLIFLYRRKYESGYKKVMMEIIPANDFSETSETFFLYVKNITV